jgi:hypothetical protein
MSTLALNFTQNTNLLLKAPVFQLGNREAMIFAQKPSNAPQKVAGGGIGLGALGALLGSVFALYKIQDIHQENKKRIAVIQKLGIFSGDEPEVQKKIDGLNKQQVQFLANLSDRIFKISPSFANNSNTLVGSEQESLKKYILTALENANTSDLDGILKYIQQRYPHLLGGSGNGNNSNGGRIKTGDECPDFPERGVIKTFGDLPDFIKKSKYLQQTYAPQKKTYEGLLREIFALASANNASITISYPVLEISKNGKITKIPLPEIKCSAGKVTEEDFDRKTFENRYRSFGRSLSN